MVVVLAAIQSSVVIQVESIVSSYEHYEVSLHINELIS